MAIGMVSSGMAAATTAATVSAGAFIGSATAYGVAAITAASSSNTIKEFNDRGNWGTVAATASGGLLGGYSGYTVSKSQISSPNRGFETFDQLKKEIGSPGEGKEWHHIVEQCQMKKSGFTTQMIQNTGNIISISKGTHRAISGYYSSIQPFTGGVTVRNWLAGQSFEAQYEFGLNVIQMFP